MSDIHCELERTKHITRPAIFAKVVLIPAKCLTETDQQLRPTFQASHLIAWAGLQALGQFLNRQIVQPILVNLELVVAVAGK